MPLYEYECDACGERYELIRKFSDPPLEACPKCGQGPVRKLVSSPAFQFKGSGWYITDYARKGESDKSSAGKPSKADATDKPEAGATPASEPAKTESAPAADKPAASASTPGKPEKP